MDYELLKEIPCLPPSDESPKEQLMDLIAIAQRLGLRGAAEIIRGTLREGTPEVFKIAS